MNPIHEQQYAEIEKTEIGMEILQNARNELAVRMRFLSPALWSLIFSGVPWVRGMGTDGSFLYFEPEALIERYKKGRAYVNRSCLHSLFHCIFWHLGAVGDREEELFFLASDIAVEYVIDGLHEKCVHIPKSRMRRALYEKLERDLQVVTAEGVYHWLIEQQVSPSERLLWSREFQVDDHAPWKQPPRHGKAPHENQQKWQDMREKMQTEMETFGKEAAQGSKGLLEQLQIENRERYDYRDFLRKFSVLKEEMKVDMDSFDYIFYNYGMSLYGNMPLIEPQETKELQRVEEFIIVIDTSMSCKGELVRHFLEETYSVLAESESFFRRIHIHILQCDDSVQSDQVITSQEELKAYMEHLEIKGLGGTDFRPAFAYVNELLAKKTFQKLRGLIYFTDGYGTFPMQMPPYETAFVFLQENYTDLDVPPWAIKLILEPEDLMLKNRKTGATEEKVS